MYDLADPRFDDPDFRKMVMQRAREKLRHPYQLGSYFDELADGTVVQSLVVEPVSAETLEWYRQFLIKWGEEPPARITFIRPHESSP